MAITKSQKREIVKQYADWASSSQALFLAQYTGLNMKQMDELRAKLRAVDGAFHIVKNTLLSLALKEAGVDLPQEYLEGSTAICFAFSDAPGVAKVIANTAKELDFVKIKCGSLDKQFISMDDVKALASLPPLPIMRAQLLGVLTAPASKFVRTLVEPARQMAAVVQAKVDATQPVA